MKNKINKEEWRSMNTTQQNRIIGKEPSGTQNKNRTWHKCKAAFISIMNVFVLIR
jgi:hypothetical protein